MNLTSLAASRLSGRPWAIAPVRLEGMLAAAAALGPGADLPPWLQDITRPQQGYTVTKSGIAVVPVLGLLVARGDWLKDLLGATEYGAIADAVAGAADDPAVRGILLDVDSPGGEVGGLFNLVEAIDAVKQRSAKPLWAVASESALSAAYAIASAADRLYVSRTGEAGSIGVVAVHIDESGANAMAGLKWTLIHAGARKTDGNPHEPLSPRAMIDIQADVDALYDALVALVAGNRGLSTDAIRTTEAAIYRGDKAVKAGLADRVGTVGQAVADLEAALQTKRIRAGPPLSRSARPPSPPSRTNAMNTSDPMIGETDIDPPQDTNPTDCAPLLPPEAGVVPAAARAEPPLLAPDADARAIADCLRAEFAEIAAVATQAARLGIEIDAADAMRRGLKPDALRQTILDKLVVRSEAADVVAIAPQPAQPTANSPIVRRARERAAAGSR